MSQAGKAPEATEGERALVKVVKAIAQFLFFFALVVTVMWLLGWAYMMGVQDGQAPRSW